MVSVSSRINSDTTEGSDIGFDVVVVVAGAEVEVVADDEVEEEEEEEEEEEDEVVGRITVSESIAITSSILLEIETLDLTSKLLSFVNNINDCKEKK